MIGLGSDKKEFEKTLIALETPPPLMAKVMKNYHFFGTLPLNTEGPLLDVNFWKLKLLGGIKKNTLFYFYK